MQITCMLVVLVNALLYVPNLFLEDEKEKCSMFYAGKF